MMDYPYRSQWDPDGNQRVNDCGPACVAMVLDRFGQQVAINAISAETMGSADQGTTANQLVVSLRKRDVNALAWTGMDMPKLPAICLVRYDGFDRSNVQDVNFRGWHWLILLSVNEYTAVCHDPDYAGARRNEGRLKRYGRAEFERAFIPYGQSKIAIVWDENMTETKASIETMSETGTVTSDMAFLRLRALPQGEIVAHIQNGARVEIVGKRDAWYQARFTANYPALYQDEAMTTRVQAEMSGWVYAPFITLDAPTPVTLPRIGVNVISDGNAARAAIAAGCKFISVTFNPDLAIELKRNYPDVLVAHRANFYKGHLPSIDEFKEKHGLAYREPGMIVYGVNEDDQIGHSNEDIRKRAEWDRGMWLICQSYGSRFAGGGFAMGTPDVTQMSVRDVLGVVYPPLVNNGMLFNQHTYSGSDGSKVPVKQRIFSTDVNRITWDGITAETRQTWWLEEREKFYVAFCGFTNATFISDETGMDEMGTGGFAAHGYTDVEVAAWCKRYQQIKSEPLKVNGNVVPFRFIGGALFQSGDTGMWRGYEQQPYFGAIKAAGVWS